MKWVSSLVILHRGFGVHLMVLWGKQSLQPIYQRHSLGSELQFQRAWSPKAIGKREEKDMVQGSYMVQLWTLFQLADTGH